jgi:hypothetical protein
MTAERSSEDNDGHQVRATIGLAGGCALHRADQSGIMSRFPEAWQRGRRSLRSPVVCQRCQGFIRHQRSRPGRWALRPASFAPGFRGLSEGFIDFEALVAAAAGSRHCPRPPPLARLDPPPGRMACYCRSRRPATSGPNRPSCSRPSRSSMSGEDIRKSLNGVLRRELSRARQFDRSTSA